MSGGFGGWIEMSPMTGAVVAEWVVIHLSAKFCDSSGHGFIFLVHCLKNLHLRL
ncbi:hypothetical protein Scep_014290 [Stephania cephalantha]|uniref:Uncharacterized protein n=1 Tax=Stephania cephalantha TaxID=152367 RepID=A0AAP0J0Z9_9MAGN